MTRRRFASSHDSQPGSAIGYVLSTARGLRCRASRQCPQVFHPHDHGRTYEAVAIAALARDTHEQMAHGYRHVRVREDKDGWAKIPVGRGRAAGAPRFR